MGSRDARFLQSLINHCGKLPRNLLTYNFIRLNHWALYQFKAAAILYNFVSWKGINMSQLILGRERGAN